MKWNNKFNYPKTSRSIEDGYRKYLLGENKLPSVTTILSTTKSEDCLLYTSDAADDA